jgi:hypothetical protein
MPDTSESFELILDEPWQALALARTRGVLAEGLEMITNDLVQHAPGRGPGLIR